MNQALDRVKNDVETIQKAMGLAPALGREWMQWLRRDLWFSLWWCLPGFILIAAALLPFDHASRYGGLVAEQWAGILVAATLLGLAAAHGRHVTARDGRPAGVVREARRTNGMSAQGVWFGVALCAQLVLYFVWGRRYHIAFEPFWAGLFILMGSTCLVAALTASAWNLLGYALPFLAYGLCLPMAEGRPQMKGVLLGLMFIGVALSFSLVNFCQIRSLERQNDTH